MPCFTLPNIQFPLLPAIQITIPLINAAINAWASYEELQIYKDHRSKLNALSDRNMTIGRQAKAKNNEVEAKRAALYARLCEQPQCEPCCDDVKLSVFSAMGNVFKRYQNQSEQLHHSQCGMKETLIRSALDELPKAISNTAAVYNQEYNFCESVRQDYLRGVTSSAYRGEVPSPGVLSAIAQSNAENLNDSSILFSQFFSETTRSIGLEIGRRNIEERNSRNNFSVGLQSNQLNSPVTNQQPAVLQQTPAFGVGIETIRTDFLGSPPPSSFGGNNG